MQKHALAFEDWLTVPPDLSDPSMLREIIRSSQEMIGDKVSIGLEGTSCVVRSDSEDLVARALLLLDNNIQQQLVYLRRLGVKERLQEERNRVENEIQSGLRVEFPVDPEVLGMLIGTQGANVRKVTNECGVDRVVVDRDRAVVRIVGKTKEDVARARRALEVCSVEVAVPENQMGHIVGRSRQNIQEMKDRTGVQSIQVEDKRSCLRLLGTRPAVESAELLIRSKLEHLAKMDREALELDQLRKELQ
ncbi:hypothetical protein CYMTET_36044, partial [Cymbomonas tetramitiformis]